MKNKFLLIVYCFISISVFAFGFKVYGVTEEELKEKKNDIERQIENANTEIAGIKEKMTSSLEQIARLNIQINEYEEILEDNTERLDELNSELDERKEQLEEAQRTYDEQKELIDKRLIAIYESSKTTYLDILVGSTSLSDFFTKYYILEELAEYDSKLLQSLDIHKNAVEIENGLFNNKRQEVQSAKDTVEAKTRAMEVLKNDKKNLIETLSQEEITLNEQLEQFEIDKKEVEKELVELAKRNDIAKSLKPSQSGYISPLIGKTKANITTGYYGYSGHTGVDFAIPLGTDVVAVKDGTVVISDARKNSNGTYRSYGEYVVIDHHDGTMTLYAHGSPNTRVVNEGDEVVRRTGNYEIWNNWEFYWSTFTF